MLNQEQFTELQSIITKFSKSQVPHSDKIAHGTRVIGNEDGYAFIVAVGRALFYEMSLGRRYKELSEEHFLKLFEIWTTEGSCWREIDMGYDSEQELFENLANHYYGDGFDIKTSGDAFAIAIINAVDISNYPPEAKKIYMARPNKAKIISLCYHLQLLAAKDASFYITGKAVGRMCKKTQPWGAGTLKTLIREGIIREDKQFNTRVTDKAGNVVWLAKHYYYTNMITQQESDDCDDMKARVQARLAAAREKREDWAISTAIPIENEDELGACDRARVQARNTSAKEKRAG